MVSIAVPFDTTSTHLPRLLHAADRTDRCELAALRSDRSVAVFDQVRMQVADLMRTRRPAEPPTGQALADLVDEFMGGGDADGVGVWVFYPWSKRLVHLLDQDDFIELRTDRNRDKVTVEEQAVLATKAVGVVGLSAGSAVALTVALERGCGRLRLADFDVIDLSNLNRLRCGVHELGVSKAVVTARAIAELDPFLPVELLTEGVDHTNFDAFFDGLDLVVDECDSIDVKLDLRLWARKLGLPVVMATSDGGMLDVERYDFDNDLEPFHGLVGEVVPGQIAGLPRDEMISWVTRLLPPEQLSERMLGSLPCIGSTLSTWPQLAADVAIGGGQVAAVARRILLGQPVDSGRTFASRLC